MAEVINNNRDYRRSPFFPSPFPDGHTETPILSPSSPCFHQSSSLSSKPSNFQDKTSNCYNPSNFNNNFQKYTNKTHQEGLFELERNIPVHYTASMPDFQVFLISDVVEDEKKILFEKKLLQSLDHTPGYDHIEKENKRISKSPTMGYSSEAPARLNSPQRFLKPFRQRAVSLSILERSCESFVTLENTSTALFDLPTLVSRADTGLKYGVDPILAEGAMGGTYFLRDKGRLITVVCKPGDEEPNSPNNPYQEQNGFLGSAYKGRIIPGKIMVKIDYLYSYILILEGRGVCSTG